MNHCITYGSQSCLLLALLGICPLMDLSDFAVPKTQSCSKVGITVNISVQNHMTKNNTLVQTSQMHPNMGGLVFISLSLLVMSMLG